MDKTNIKAEFHIESKTLTVAQLTEKIGIKPTYSRERGAVLKSGIITECSIWEIGTEYEESLDINESIGKLLPIINNYKKNISKLIENNEGEAGFCIVVIIEEGQTPIMGLEREFIKLLSELKAEIFFDTYVMSI